MLQALLDVAMLSTQRKCNKLALWVKNSNYFTSVLSL